MARPCKRQRERARRQHAEEAERDAGMLPADGSIADLVARISKELDRCVAAGREPSECVALLQPLGLEAFTLVGSIRGLRAVRWKASNQGNGQPDARTRILNGAWVGIGDGRGVWTHKGRSDG